VFRYDIFVVATNRDIVSIDHHIVRMITFDPIQGHNIGAMYTQELARRQEVFRDTDFLLGSIYFTVRYDLYIVPYTFNPLDLVRVQLYQRNSSLCGLYR